METTDAPYSNITVVHTALELQNAVRSGAGKFPHHGVNIFLFQLYRLIPMALLISVTSRYKSTKSRHQRPADRQECFPLERRVL